jgi:hypothetical protein
MLIGAIGAGVGTATGLGYTFYAKETKMSFNNSLPLEVTYNLEKNCSNCFGFICSGYYCVIIPIV